MNSLFKIFGGKHYLKDWIISNFPPNYEKMHFIDLFCGSGTITFNKKPSVWPYIEIMNDLDVGICDLLESLKYNFLEFKAAVSVLDYHEDTFKLAQQNHQWTKNQTINSGLNRYILSRMSRAGMCKHFSKSDRLRGGRPEGINSWENAKWQLGKFADRLQNIDVFNIDGVLALDCNINHPDILFYIDPPYLHSTRKSKAVYSHEMPEREHIALAVSANRAKGKVLVSGYNSDLYNRLYSSPKWTKIERQIVNHSSQAKKKPVKIEVLWKNY